MRSEYTATRNIMIAVVAIIALSACSQDKKTPPAATAPDTAVIANEMTPRDSLGRPVGKVIRPAVLNGTIRKGGNIEIVPMELIQPIAGFPGLFTTYKTQDMQMASAKIGSTGTITLSPLFGGTTDPNAFIQIQFDASKVAATAPADSAFEAVTKGLKISKPVLTDVSEYAWADGAKSFRYTLAGRQIAGTMIVGHRGPNKFHILTQYPPTYSETMAQRLNLIVNQWRWDDYAYLVPSGLKPLAETSQTDSAAKVPLPTTKRK